MQINPLFVFPANNSHFHTFVWGPWAKQNHIRKLENVDIYRPVEERDDPVHGSQRGLYGTGVNPWGRAIPVWLTSTAGDPTHANQ